MTSSRPLPTTSSINAQPHQQSRRSFQIPVLRIRFQCTKRRLRDAVADFIGWLVESFVYAIGPLLILLALGIIYILTYTFVTVLLPMLKDKYQRRAIDATTGKYTHNFFIPLHQQLHLGLHCIFVAFVVANILYNYFYCVMTKHKGNKYDSVVREQAQATDFVYPETPAQVQQYRQEFQDRMALRIRRRRERAQQANQAATVQQKRAEGPSASEMNGDTLSAQNEASTGKGMTQRRGGQNQVDEESNASVASKVPTVTTIAKQPTVRQWMLLAPFEWSYCIHSNQPKPPRSHYDHVTKCLVLNLDHYCPWMFNSVGYFNYRYFVNFLIYIFIGMLYGALLTLQPFLSLGSPEYRLQWKQQKNGFALEHRLKPMLPFREERMLISLSFMLCAAVGLAVLLLGGFHVYLTCTAQTTIEFHGNWTARRRAKAAGQKWRNPYSQGSWYKNWQQVYGHDRNFFLAFLPSNREPDTLPAPVPGRELRRRIESLSSAANDEYDGPEDIV